MSYPFRLPLDKLKRFFTRERIGFLPILFKLNTLFFRLG